MTCNCRSHNGFLTAKGLEETAQQFSLEGLHLRDGVDSRALNTYLDKVVSVSASQRDETSMIFDDEVLDEQFERSESSQ